MRPDPLLFFCSALHTQQLPLLEENHITASEHQPSPAAAWSSTCISLSHSQGKGFKDGGCYQEGGEKGSASPLGPQRCGSSRTPFPSPAVWLEHPGDPEHGLEWCVLY